MSRDCAAQAFSKVLLFRPFTFSTHIVHELPQPFVPFRILGRLPDQVLALAFPLFASWLSVRSRGARRLPLARRCVSVRELVQADALALALVRRTVRGRCRAGCFGGNFASHSLLGFGEASLAEVFQDDGIIGCVCWVSKRPWIVFCELIDAHLSCEGWPVAGVEGLGGMLGSAT